jgi:hypothetical protein
MKATLNGRACGGARLPQRVDLTKAGLLFLAQCGSLIGRRRRRDEHLAF